ERTHLVLLQRAVVEQHAGDDERPGERAATGLVRAGDESRPELAVESKELLAGPLHRPETSALVGRCDSLFFGHGLVGLVDRLRFLDCGLLRLHGPAVAALAHTRLLPHTAAEVVELRPVHVTDRSDVDLLDLGGVQRERALHTDAERLLADGERLPGTGSLPLDDDA